MALSKLVRMAMDHVHDALQASATELLVHSFAFLIWLTKPSEAGLSPTSPLPYAVVASVVALSQVLDLVFGAVKSKTPRPRTMYKEQSLLADRALLVLRVGFVVCPSCSA
eukprot:6206482-Pleurochrysis_carterae.AAC.3